MMTIKQFSKKYDLDIIPVSNERLTFGKCVWDDAIFGKPKFNHGSMPDYILNTFIDAELMTVDEAELSLKKYRDQPLEKAGFFNVNVDIETNIATEINLDDQTNLKNEIKANKIVKFTFSDIQYKELSFSDRVNIDIKLDKIKADHWKDYSQDLRKAYIITQLYYGKIKVYIKKEFDHELNLTLKGFILKNDISTNSILEYEFDNNNLPFAMKLERVKHFN
jgi:hypothetical protein